MEPEKGISSIRAVSYAISQLKEGWIDKETTVNVGMIKGGEVRNTVPEKTEVKMECRSQSHEKCLRQSELIREVFVKAAESLRATADVKMELQINAYHISEDAESVGVARRAVANVGLEPSVKIICGGTDAAHYNEMGIETVVIGTGGKGEHTRQENIAVKDMEKAVKMIQQILDELSM
jgi:tripeptide aminopeptidase